MESSLLTVEDIAQRLKVKPKCVHAYVREGKLGCVQISPRERRFTEAQFQAFIESRTITPPKKVDVAATRPIGSAPSSKKGGAISEGISVRARLREELRSW